MIKASSYKVQETIVVARVVHVRPPFQRRHSVLLAARAHGSCGPSLSSADVLQGKFAHALGVVRPRVARHHRGALVLARGEGDAEKHLFGEVCTVSIAARRLSAKTIVSG